MKVPLVLHSGQNAETHLSYAVVEMLSINQNPVFIRFRMHYRVDNSCNFKISKIKWHCWWDIVVEKLGWTFLPAAWIKVLGTQCYLHSGKECSQEKVIQQIENLARILDVEWELECGMSIKKNRAAEEMLWERGGEKKKKSHRERLSRHFKILTVVEKCLLGYGIELKWYIPEGKESHFQCITLKRSQGDQTGMRVFVDHQGTRGLKRQSEREEQSVLFSYSDILLTSQVPGDTVYSACLPVCAVINLHLYMRVRA